MKRFFIITTSLLFTFSTTSFADIIWSPSPPLIRALREKKDYNAIKAMIDSGADVYKKSRGGRTVLMEAAKQNANNDIIELLIYEAAEANVVDDINQTALTFLLTNLMYDEDVDIKNVKSLIRAGVNINVVSDGDEATAYRIAKSCGREDIVELLIKSGADINKGKELPECKAKTYPIGRISDD